MVKIRRLKTQDVDFVLESTQREQWGHTKRDIERCFEYEPNGCFIAEQAKQKLGHVFTVNYGELGWIGLLIVNPEHRGKGIGTTLMEKAIDYLQRKGTKTIGLDAEQKAVPLYERFDFKKAYDSLRFRKQQPRKTKGEQSTARNIFPLRKSDLKAVARFDSKFFGANRARVLQGIYDDFEDKCWVAKRNRRILGYIMSCQDGDICRIGPWVCRPKRLETARELFEACISAANENIVEVRVGVLAANMDAVELVESLGFVQIPNSVRMFRGKQAQVGDVMGVYGIAAPEIG